MRKKVEERQGIEDYGDAKLQKKKKKNSFSFVASIGPALFYEDRTSCFMESFKNYIKGQGQTWPVTTNFTETFCTWKYVRKKDPKPFLFSFSLFWSLQLPMIFISVSF